jgi:hypothetical protein
MLRELLGVLLADVIDEWGSLSFTGDRHDHIPNLEWVCFLTHSAPFVLRNIPYLQSYTI